MPEVVIWGAGAIGGLVGAHLARGGVDVLLVDRERAHVEAMRERGLLIDGVRGELRVPVRACLPEEAPDNLEWVFLCVKCLHTEAAARQLQPKLTSKATVLSLQNGLNERYIAAICGAERTVGAFIDFGSDYMGPGHIRHGGENPIYIGELDGQARPRLETLRAWLERFTPVHLTDNIWGYLWAKTARGCAGFVGALVDAPTYEVNANPLARRLMVAAASEAVGVALAQGVRLERIGGFDPALYDPAGGRLDEAEAAIAARTQPPPNAVKVHTGIWRDLAVRRRKTEVDCIPGEVVRDADRLGLSTPVLRRLVELVHELESGRLPMEWANFDRLAGAGG